MIAGWRVFLNGAMPEAELRHLASPAYSPAVAGNELQTFREDLARYRRQDLAAAAADQVGATDGEENSIRLDRMVNKFDG